MKYMISDENKNENEKISWIDYIQKKYEIDNLDDIITLIYLSLLCSIIIYISFYFPVIHTAIIIFVVLFTCFTHRMFDSRYCLYFAYVYNVIHCLYCLSSCYCLFVLVSVLLYVMLFTFI